MFSLHGKIALVTLAFLAIAAIGLFGPLKGTEGTAIPVNLSVGHTLPLTLAISLTEGTATSLVEIDQTSSESITMDVPQAWKRTEVRRSPIASVTSEQGTGATLRWKLPANAGITFSSDSPVSDVMMHNPSGATMKIQLTRVNIAKNTSTYDVYLLKDGSLLLP